MMRELTPSVLLNETPLVTFALFAYNQEKIIREAVEGAFAQTYQPLEIILSDDCSTDRTFVVMDEMAAEYKGPHSVKVMRTEMNNGLVAHINMVIRNVSADYVVVAAGDDISAPWRVSAIASVFSAESTAMAVFSDGVAFVGNSGSLRLVPPEEIAVTQISIIETLLGFGGVGPGAGYAYKKQCFVWPEALSVTTLAEDRLLPLRAALLGRVFCIDQPLLACRKGAGRLTSYLFRTKRLAHQDRDHWQEVKKTLTKAHSMGILGFPYGWIFEKIFAVRIFCSKLNEAGSKSRPNFHRILSVMLLIPLHAIKRLSLKKRFKISGFC